jgi:hypothetical protein
MPRSVTLPDGTIVDNVPDEITDRDVLQRVEVAQTGERMTKGLAGIDGPIADPVKQLGLGAMDTVASTVGGAMGSNSTYWAIPGLGAFDAILRGVGKHIGAGDQGMREAGRDLGQLNQQIQQGNKPTTEAGKWTRSIGKELPFAPLGIGGVGAKLAQTVGAGAGAEFLGNRVGQNNPLLEALGSALGGMGTGLGLKLLPSTGDNILREAVQGLTPEDFAKARRTSDVLKGEGISHTSAQLLDTPTLPSIFNEVSQHPKVAPSVHKEFRNVPQQVTKSITDKMDLELGNPGTTRDALRSVQEATANALREEMKRANAAYGGNKAVALTGAGLADTSDVMRVAEELERRAGEFAVGSPRRQALMDARRMLFHDDIPVTAESKLDAEMLGIDPNPTFRPENAVVDKNILANINADLNALISKHNLTMEDTAVLKAKEAISRLVPEMDSVNARHAAVFDAELSPMNRSLTGRVAKFGGGPKEMRETASEGLLNQIFPNTTNQAEEIVGMGQDLRDFASRTTKPSEAAQAQSALSGVLREKMNQGLNRSSGNVAGMPNANIAGDFFNEVYRNPAQQANIQAAVSEAVLSQGKTPTQAKAATEGFHNLLEAFNTFNRVNLVPGANPYELGKQMSENIPSKLIAPFSAYSQKMQTISRARNAEELAQVLSDPAGLELLEKLAKLGPAASYGAIFASSGIRAANRMETAD